MKSLTISLLFLFLIAVFTTLPLTHASGDLSITVMTEKQDYYTGETVQIYGNLTFNETLVTDGIVGLQVQTPTNNLLIIRTLTTGTNPPTTPYVRVSLVVPCDSSGNPKNSFSKGTLAYFKMYVINYDIEPREVLMTINTYDPKNIPFSSASVRTILSGQTSSTFIVSIPIPQDANTGNATAYANVYTDWPNLEGTPYSTEVSTNFEITNGVSSQSTITTPKNQGASTLQLNGTYNTTFQLKPKATVGNYTIYATSNYQSETTFNNATFIVRPIGDFDGDLDVDFDDFTIFLSAWIDYYFDPPLDPEYYVVDFDHDNDVDFDDFTNFLTGWIDYWFP